ncbi:membrane protein insertase YidC [Streptococcus sp. HF-1907]|uniref:membrane protein insertase YidC n=1 Tax=Streptococcus sp. HF-1907 TaxID=2785793 RepID=UPI00189E2E11|nr:membrane protein insertase YidC [Streptococcus sp. HF-1907]MBF7095291.1 membrane protein insertase YidC [Streptococcus sp. HF-1907]
MKKKLNRVLFSGLALSMLMLLTGCVSVDKSTGKPYGAIWNTLGVPMANLITFFAKNQGLGFGIAIIIVTIIVRVIILPLGLYQSWKASYQSEKMAFLKPIFEPINERMKNASTQEEKLAAQTELMAAQRENGVNMLGGIGCLPLLIQMPFFSAIYFAARYAPGVSNAAFLGMDLGKQNLILTIIIAALYFVQSWLSTLSVPEEQRSQMKNMMFMMPLMMVFMSISLPASVALYWFVGGIVSIIQQLITMYILKPKLREKVAAEFEKNPPKAYKSPNPRKDVTASAKQTNQRAITTTKKGRNAGKQQRKRK